MLQYLRHIPNIITISRMLAMIPLVWLMWHKQYKASLLLAVIAGASDGLDGYLAKKYHWQGWLGGILDPLADKLMMLCCYSVFVLQNIVPVWFFVVVVARDVIIIAGATYYHFCVGKIVAATPTLISKLNTALQILFILVILVTLANYFDLSLIYWPFIILITVGSVISGLQYVWMGSVMSRNLNHNRSKESK